MVNSLADSSKSTHGTHNCRTLKMGTPAEARDRITNPTEAVHVSIERQAATFHGL